MTAYRIVDELRTDECREVCAVVPCSCDAALLRATDEWRRENADPDVHVFWFADESIAKRYLRVPGDENLELDSCLAGHYLVNAQLDGLFRGLSEPLQVYRDSGVSTWRRFLGRIRAFLMGEA